MLSTRDIEGFDARRREIAEKLKELKLSPSAETEQKIQLLLRELKELENPDLP